MSQYELQMHSRYLDLIPVAPGVTIERHSGFDLIERDENEKIIKIQSIDLINNAGKIKIGFAGPDEIIVNVNGKKQIWPTEIFLGDNAGEVDTPNYKVTEEDML